ncbi:MAG: hypothetical protein ACFFBS_06590 [Promethearchaeota archaeon]
MKARKYVLMSIFLIIIPLLLSCRPSFQYSDGGTLAFGREVVEFSKGTNYDQEAAIPTNPSVFVDIPAGWVGNQVFLDVRELADLRDWAINGTFEDGTTYISPPWQYQETNDNADVDDGRWLAANQCVYTQLPMQSGGRQFYEDESSYWNETVVIGRGHVLEAELRLSYYANDIIDRSEFEAFALIGGEYVWRLDFKTVRDSGLDEQWNNIAQYVDPDVFNLSETQYVQIDIGVRYTSGGATYSGWSDLNRVYFDNISLVLRSTVKPSQVDLRVETPDSANYSISTTDYGFGNVTFSGAWGPAAPPLFEQFYFTFLTNTSSPVEVSLKANVTVFAAYNTTSNPAAFEVDHQSNVAWSFSHRTEMSIYDEPRGEGPTKYTDYYFNLTIPSDWYLTSISDPNGISHQPGDENYTLTTLGSKKILTVNSTAIGLYGLYSCQANSKNYVSDAQLQVLTNGTWMNSSTFSDGDSIRVIAGLLDENGFPPTDLGNATISITDPSDSIWPSAVDMVVNASGIAISDVIVVPDGSLTGPYMINVDWTNGYEAGTILTTDFGKTGLIDVNLLRPTQQEANVEAGGGFWLTVELVDPITGGNVSTAVVQYELSWEPGVWHNMTKLEGQPYRDQIEVPELAGHYTVRIGVIHDFYSVEQEITVTISVWQQWYIFGVPGWLFVTIIPIVGLAGALLYVVLNPYIRFPAVVRKIMKMKKDIRKGKIPKQPGVRTRDDIQQSVFDQVTGPADAIVIPRLPTIEPPLEETEIPSEEASHSEKEGRRENQTEDVHTKDIGTRNEQPKEARSPTDEVEQVPETDTPETDQQLEAFREEIESMKGISDSDKETILRELKALPSEVRRKTLDLIKKDVNME